jgi:hypothetical protein
MANREVAMWEILNVLRCFGRGESRTSVAAVTGHSRSTIRPYEYSPSTMQSSGARAAEEASRRPGIFEVCGGPVASVARDPTHEDLAARRSSATCAA